MRNFCCALFGLLCLVSPFTSMAAKPIRVVVWDERQPAQKTVYPNFLGNYLADHLRQLPNVTVTSVGLDDPDQGLPASLLEKTDVLLWWGHVRHADVKDSLATNIVERVKSGKLALVALHSAHWSKPFVQAMTERTLEDARKSLTAAERRNARFEYTRPEKRLVKPTDPPSPAIRKEKQADGSTVVHVTLPGCVFPSVRGDGAPSHVTTLLPRHPIARGVPAKFDIPRTEMYSEPFTVPAPEAVIFREDWDKGEWFRGGAVWKLGKGRVFYFRPGHETFDVYHQAPCLKILDNAVLWLGR